MARKKLSKKQRGLMRVVRQARQAIRRSKIKASRRMRRFKDVLDADGLAGIGNPDDVLDDGSADGITQREYDQIKARIDDEVVEGFTLLPDD